MKKFLFYTFCFLLLGGIVKAQDLIESAGKLLSIRAGYQGNYLKDNALSPLHYQGSGIQYGLSYRRIGKNIFGISVAYGAGEMRSNETSGFTNTFLDINIDVEYLFRIKNNSESLDIYLGGAYETNAFFIEWNDLDAFSYTSTQGMAIRGLLTQRINDRHSMQTSFGIPIVQFLGRPPYNGIDEFIIENQDNPVKIMLQGEPASLGHYLGLDWGLVYAYQISPRLAWNLAYSISFQKVNNLHSFKRMTMSAASGITLKF
ncbi:hypothetical protein [uncultured Cyclobacterium sp.]|uniref:hypothetical protein n=1 Tax=uncultured Cyclobacterium sp. TaxID=453820 RepID=UPI0030ED4933